MHFNLKTWPVLDTANSITSISQVIIVFYTSITSISQIIIVIYVSALMLHGMIASSKKLKLAYASQLFQKLPHN